MSNLKPDIVMGSVTQLNPEAIREDFPGIKAIAFDLDKTLTGQHDPAIPDEHLETIQVLSDAQFNIGIISNARSFVRAGRVHQIKGQIGRAIRSEVFVVTSLELNGVSKPSSEPFEMMAIKMSMQPWQIGYVGDQLFKDILGARRANYGLSVLVAPFGEGDNPGVKYLQRPIESIARLGMGLPFRTKKFGNKV
jgi:HAD superfamily hydrolase (TIGR01662 family)